MASYYGPGSTGASPGFQREDPIPMPAGGMFQQGGRGYLGPGPLPPQGYAMWDGSVVYGTLMPDGSIQGQVKTPDGRMVSGQFGLDPLGRSIDPQSLSSAMASSAGGGDAKLEEQRRLAFGSLNQGANYFNSPLGNQTYNSLSNTQAGIDVPYTQEVQDRMFSQQGDLAAGQEAGAQDRIRSSFANRGMEGSGGELAAMLGAGRERSAQNTQALTEIQNKAQLENFGARERAREASTGFMGARSSAEAPYRLKEADLRSRFEVTGQSPLGALGGMLGMGGGNSLAGMSGNAARTGPAGFRAQSSMDAMTRARQNGGILNGNSGFSFVSQQGGAPTVSPVSAWDQVGGADYLGGAPTGSGFKRATSYPQGGSPWGMSSAFMQAPLTPTNNLFGPGQNTDKNAAYDPTKLMSASGLGGMLGGTFRGQG